MNSAHIKNLIEDYLEKIKENLPSWIREDEDESSEILEEMKEHIWDLAQDLAGGSEDAIAPSHIQEAIARMGRPVDIAKEYKKRGTPKIFISAEWWAWYTKIGRLVLGILWGINILAIVFSLGKPFWEIVGSLLSGLWNSTLYASIVISLIFVALSMEGFLPKDFPELFEKYKVLVKEEKSEEVPKHESHFQTNSAQKRAKRAEERARRAADRAQRSDEYAREIDIDLSGKKRKKNKPPISVGGLLGDGIWGILWAIFIIVQPIASINAKLTPEFLLWIQLTGFLGFSIALIKIFQAFVGIHKPLIQQSLLLLILAAELMNIPIFLEAIGNPAVLTIFSAAANVAWDPTKVFTIVMWISIVGTGIGGLEKLGKVFSYRGKLNRYYDRQ